MDIQINPIQFPTQTRMIMNRAKKINVINGQIMRMKERYKSKYHSNDVFGVELQANGCWWSLKSLTTKLQKIKKLEWEISNILQSTQPALPELM